MPAALLDTVQQRLTEKLQKVVIGDPAQDGVTMGALASVKQKHDVAAKVEQLAQEAEIIMVATCQDFSIQVAHPEKSAFYPPTVLLCKDPVQAQQIHNIEAFGPVVTLMPYSDLSQLATLVARGEGSLVASIVRNHDENIEQLLSKIAPWHGRVHILDREAPRKVPVMVHHSHC